MDTRRYGEFEADKVAFTAAGSRKKPDLGWMDNHVHGM